MAQKNKNITTKKAKKSVKPVEAPVEQVVVETVEETKTPKEKPEEKVNTTNITTKNMVGRVNSSLDANHRVDLLNLADDIFRKDPDAERKFTLEIRDSVNAIVAAGVVAALADESVYGTSTFSAVLNHAMYPQLVIAAKEMGVTLPNVKALPVNEKDEVIVESDKIKVSKDAKKKLQEEHAIEEKKPELDPVKVADMGEEALKEALQYLLIVGPKKTNIKNTLVNVVDFMRTYRMTMADKAENVAEAKLKYDGYTVDKWLMDAFSYVKPTFLLHGIGRGLITMASLAKSPVSSFCILRRTLTDPETNKPVWDDQSIADAVKAIIYLVASNAIADEQKNLDALDKKAKDYKEVSEKYKNSIDHYKKILEYVSNPDFDVINTMIQKMDDDKDPVATKLFNYVKDQYYPNVARGGYKNLDYDVVQRAGIITNMFITEADRNEDYNEVNIQELVAYTTEEIKEMREAEAKAKAEAKKEESKNA